MPVVNQGVREIVTLQVGQPIFVTSTGSAALTYDQELVSSPRTVASDSGEVRIGPFEIQVDVTINPVIGTVTYNYQPTVIQPLNTNSTPLDVAESFNLLSRGSSALMAQTGSPRAPNFAVYREVNTIDPATEGSAIWGVGWSIFPNRIGSPTKPVGTDYTNPSLWADDIGYLSATINNASVASINSCYDNICNQIAGVIDGAHQFIQYHPEGHSRIGGGSYNWISAGRSVIHYATNGRINGSGTYNGIHNGFTNAIIDGYHNNIFSGELNTINTPGQGFNAASGQNNQILGSSRYCVVDSIGATVTDSARSALIGGQSSSMNTSTDSAIIGGNNIDHTNTARCFSGAGENSTMSGATYSVNLGGQGNTQTGRSSFMAAAEESNDNGARGLFTGRKAQGLGAHFQATIGCNHPTTGVLSQGMTVVQGVTTTGASLNPPPEQMITVGNTGLTTITGNVYVTARNTTDNKTAGYTVNFVAQWDGTTYFLNGTTADLAMTQIFADASSNITAPTLAFSAGQLRVRFGGTASKTVNWSAVIDCVVMRA